MTDARHEYYEEYWRSPRIEGHSPHQRWKAKITREHPRVRACTSLLDVGCGDGSLLRALGKRGARLCGVDIADHAVANLAASGIEGWSVDLDSGRLPFEDESFEVVTCYDVLEHLFDPRALLREIRRVLRRDGLALLCVPNTLNAFNRLLFLLGDYVDIMDTSHRSDEMFSNHIRLFSKRLFEKFVTSEGFTIEERHYYFPDAFSDARFRLPPQLTKIVTLPGLPSRLPSMFALGFLYGCARS
jgi:2-polyprenyl-3-methyl-5-hydroxy-6-metoxy-1,4-benzoquinol methylase